MKRRRASNAMVTPGREGESRAAIVAAAERLFLEDGFGGVSMDDLAASAGVARRTLYNQFGSKEEIFRAMLVQVSDQLERALPPGIETRGDADNVLLLIARGILEFLQRPGYFGLVRMVVADSRRFPWVAEAFAALVEPRMERLARYLAHLTAVRILGCRNPVLAAYQFTGLIHEVFLWPRIMGRRGPSLSAEEVAKEAVRMFLQRYRLPRPPRRS